MDGAKENLLATNSALKPRAFSKITNDLKRLSACIKWCAARKAWVNSTVLKECLLRLNLKMKVQNRNILLFLDNFAGNVLTVEEAEEH